MTAALENFENEGSKLDRQYGTIRARKIRLRMAELIAAMSNTTTNQYQPDYVVTPGEVLEDYLENLGMTQAELSSRTGLAKKTINEIVRGKSPITPETALKLERTLGRPAHFWNNLEQRFQEDKIRLADRKRLQDHLDWLKRIPVRAMINLTMCCRQTQGIN